MNLKENKIVNQNNIVTMIIIAINVVLYIITAIMSKNILDINAYVLLYMGGNYGALVSHGQVWRLLTCAFLHGGLIHILCNMYALYAIGPQVEILFGRVKYIIIYFFVCYRWKFIKLYMFTKQFINRCIRCNFWPFWSYGSFCT